MQRLRVVLTTLLAHYRRHPGQLAMLLVGLWVASALWSGVQAINASARDSYARAEALFSTQLDSIQRRDGEPLTLEDYAALRRAGQPVSPLLEGRITLANGERLDVMGIDPLSLPAGSGWQSTDDATDLTVFVTPPWRTRLAPDTLTRLGTGENEQAVPGSRPRLENGQRLPPLEVVPSLPPDTLIMDIAPAAALLERANTIDRLLVAPDQPTDLPSAFQRQAGDQLPAPDQLTGSFHLNLTAMGLLALVVGFLIVHAALGLALEQRLDMLRTLRALGVSGRELTLALGLEMLLIGLLGAVLGVISGVWIAGALLPDVASTLRSLYDAQVGVRLSLPWYYWLGGVAITLGGLATAGLGMLWRTARLNVLALGQAQAWRGGFRRQLGRMTLGGGLLWLIALALYLWLLGRPAGEGLVSGFLMVAAALLGSALLLPGLLAWLLAKLTGRENHPLRQWAFADTQLQLPKLSLAMMALLLALSANLGVSSMVGGFRLTFLDWLDQRLVADLYLRPGEERYIEVIDWLEGRADIIALLPNRQTEARLDAGKQSRPVSIDGITPAPALTERWPLLDTLDGREQAWQAVAEGASLINEQLAIAAGLELGQKIILATSRGPFETRIVGVYPDYGNPREEVVLAESLVASRFEAPPDSVGLVLEESSDGESLLADLDRRFGADSMSVIDRRGIRELAIEIFERTFTITRALNALTLGVAALALFTSLLAQARTRRAQLAPLWALGVPRRPLALVSLVQLGGLALVTALVAIPLGIALTWALVAVINVAAFGWRLPLHVFPLQILWTLGLAVLVAWLAALLPAWRLWRIPPRALLAEFEGK
ncbi:FtsX-like permease family protein [Pistricoccus aurantiacus]|uniref:FtsX-like permease family protein n=1 Tax=Pistricoccus aurantiacus TaxID=1883414 RepID=UPI00363CAEDB